MTPFTRPELVVRRCDELLSVGQPQAALSSISEVFSSKRFRTTPLSVLEPIMLKFLALCVDLKKGRTAKEGLHMYKNVAQNTSVQSVEVVVLHFLAKSKEKLADALAKVDEAAAAEAGDSPTTAAAEAGTKEEVEDLEASETPESILLSAVSEEKSKDRTYRTVVTPSLRFLWEAYRTALDILRNNARLEVIYQTISHEAFTFCLTHSRKTEFRRLAETLRAHLSSSQKYTNQSFSLNLNDPDTLQRHLDTRFAQLNTAVELELWQEAFRTAEDIHGLLGMSKRQPKNSMMASFFERMVRVFSVGGNFLFHAAAYGRLYALHAGRIAQLGEKATAEDVADLEQLSGLVLLSALAVPATTEGKEEGRGKQGRLAALLGLNSAPTRAGLITDIINKHVLKRVSPELNELYQILEIDFHPLSITSKIEPILSTLANSPSTAPYVAPLKEVVLSRLFQQLSQAYASLKLERVVRLARYSADEELDTRARVERFVTEACKKGDLRVSIDHMEGSIKFQEDLFGASSVASTSAAPATEDSDSVQMLQPSPSMLLKTSLSRLAQTLHAALDIIHPNEASSPLFAATAVKEAAFAALLDKGEKERQQLIERRKIIAVRKKLAEEESVKNEKEAAAKRATALALKAEEDAKKARELARNKELERAKADIEKQKQEEARKLAQALKEKGKLTVDLDTLDTLDTGKLVQLQVEQIEKEKKDLSTKLTIVSKRIDHLERAFRKEEIALVQKDYERQQKEDQVAFEDAQKTRAVELKAQHAADVETKKRLARIMPEILAFRTRKEASSRSEFEALKAKKDEQLAEAKAERKARILREREERRAEQEAYEKEEAERRAREEEEERQRAEEAEAEERERAEIEERKRKMAEEAEAEVTARRAAREAERAADAEKIRKQLEREEEALNRKRDAPAPARAVPGASSSWRREAPPAAAAPAAAPTGERRRLQLAPRSTPVPAATAAATDAPVSRTASPAENNSGTSTPVNGAAAAAGSWRRSEGPTTIVGENRWQPKTRTPELPPKDNKDDGFTPVSKPASGGKWVPPARRQQENGAPAPRKW